MDDYARQVYLDAVSQLRLATSASARSSVVGQVMSRLGVSQPTAYRQLKSLGWDSGRKPRADKGESAVDAESARTVARLMAKGRDAKGRPQLPVTEAVAVAQQEGLLPEVSVSTVLRALARHGLAPSQMLAPTPGISRVSQHPNHVWVVDVSPCIQWYFRGEDGKYLDQYADGAQRFYAGKSNNFPKKRLLRYLAVDHYSGAYFVHYYYAEGENALDMVDFLFRAFAQKRHHGAFPFRGLPRRILMDQGPAGKSALLQNLCKSLNIILELHAPGNAKASGAVESRHFAWQRHFEGRLALARGRDLAQVNAWAEADCAVQNGQAPHSRHGKPPLSIWTTIRGEQLREAPPRQMFFQLAAASPRTAVLTNRLWLRADGRTWQIRGDRIHPRQKVSYRLSPFLDQGIRVWANDGSELVATEVAFNAAGLPTAGAHIHVWDDPAQAGSTAPMTAGQDLAARMAAGEMETALPDLFAGLEADLERQHYLSASGQAWTATSDVLAAPLLLGRVDALARASEALGRWLTDAEIAALGEAVGEGCTEDDLAAALEQLLHGGAVAGVGT